MEAEARVDSYAMPLDAELAKAYLESYEIPVRLEGETLVGSAYALGPMIGGITLYVDEHDERRARVLLDEYHRALREPRRDSYDDEEAEDRDNSGDLIARQPQSGSHMPATTESRRGSRLKDAGDEDATHAWVAALAGLVVFPVLTHCYSIACLLQVPRATLTSRGKRRYLVAWFINLTVLFAASFVLWRWFTTG
jgi:hypothetical protein